MMRALKIGILLCVVSAIGFYLHLYQQLYFLSRNELIAIANGMLLAVLTAALYRRLAKGCYGKTFCFWVLSAAALFVLVPVSADDLYLSMTGGAYGGLGGGGGFALLFTSGIFLLSYFLVFGVSCLSFHLYATFKKELPSL